MGIFSKAKKEELALVFDIGSSSVGGALFSMSESGVPKILYSVREPIILEEKINFDRFLLLTLRALNEVAGKIYQTRLGAPKSFFCVLSSPWYSSQLRTIKLQKNNLFVFNSKLADSLIQKEIAFFAEENLQKNIGEENKWEPIELKNIKTVLNGYVTGEPLDQKTKELQMDIFMSMSPELVLKDIRTTIAKYFHFRELKFSSFAMASFVVVRDIFTRQDNFLLIDIGGEITDISMIKNGALSESISFPMGPNFVVRGVSSELHVTIGEARSLISLYEDGHANASTAKKLKNIIMQLKNTWLLKFQESLSNLSNDISIPSTIFIAVDKDFSEFFADTIKSEQFNQYTLTESKFEVFFLDTGVFHDRAVFGENVGRDPFLMMEAIYANKFLR